MQNSIQILSLATLFAALLFTSSSHALYLFITNAQAKNNARS